MGLLRFLAALVLLAALLPPLSRAQAPSSPTLAIVAATVIPMDGDRVLPGQTILVSGNRITAVGPADEVAVPEGVRRLDGGGKYVIPALAEMHAHIPGGQATDQEIERVLFLYAANGIGTIRGMLGHPRHLALRDRANRGELVSPWIYTSGPSLNGNTVPTPEAARDAVRDQKAAGYDFLKIHAGILRGPFDALAAAANTAGMRMSGHVPADVGLSRALEVPYASIDHLDGYVEALAGEGAPASQLFGVNLAGRVDVSRIPQLAAATRDAGVSNVPTQALLEHWVGPHEPEAMARWPEMKYVAEQDLANWIELKHKFDSTAPAPERARFLEIRRALIKTLHDGGARLLLGSDAPQTWNVPGFSIHRELQYLVRAGLTPYQALESGTSRVAAFFGTTAERGTIGRGKRADLVVLDGNPLDDIANTARISAVVLGGRVLARSDIDQRLAALEAPRTNARGREGAKAWIDGAGPGWRALGKSDFAAVNGAPDTWAWQGDVLRSTGLPIGVMRTSDVFTNFEIVIEWRHLHAGGNSGLFTWVPPDALAGLAPGRLPEAGIEVQMLDHDFRPRYEAETGKTGDWFTTDGDVFAVGRSKLLPFEPRSPNGSRSFPREPRSRGVGEWNHYYVRGVNGELRLWVNGAEVSGGNGADPRTGYLCLEAEGAPIEFRNIRVRALP